MTERITVDVGAQYVGDAVRLAVLSAGTDDAGPYAVVLVGSHPDATKVRLREGTPHPLAGGRTLRLGGVAPAGYRPAVALEIGDAGTAGAAP